MPFIKKNQSQDTQSSSSFVGRTGEILFFIHNILQPEVPTHNILSISGQGGVGKSTLLGRVMALAQDAQFKDYCLAALIDERQSTPVSMMEQFASQLHLAGGFAKALTQYKEALGRQLGEQETLRDTLLENTPDVAGAMIEGVPIAGPLLREVTRSAATHLLKGHHVSYIRRGREFLERSIDELTTAFVTELNRLADTNVTLGATGHKRQRRLVLFLDTFEKTATEAVPWLLYSFLTAQISGNVVLVVAGRDPIEHAAHDPKPWLPYAESGVISWMPLQSFTEEETSTYLNRRGITNSEKVETLWHLSRGLPLYLGLLSCNLQGEIDPAKDVIANFMRWVPEQEHVKRQLALEAALLSRPFNQDDLEVFSSLAESDRFPLYQWLIEQPFVRSQAQNGRYLYHDVARELFCRHLYQRSQKRYYAIRREMAAYYQELLQSILTERGEREGYHSEEGLELLAALIAQLLFLPDHPSHIKAIEHIFRACNWYPIDVPPEEKQIARILRELSKELSSSQGNTHALEVVELLLYCTDGVGEPLEAGGALLKKRLFAVTALLDKVIHTPSSSSDTLAYIYNTRGWTYLFQHHESYQQALADFDHALQLNAQLADAYAGRGWYYYLCRCEYQQALIDFDRALQLDPKNTGACDGRCHVHMRLKEYKQVLIAADLYIKAYPKLPWGYTQCGCACTALKEYEQALANFDHALQLDSNYDVAYHFRGVTYLWLKNLEQARTDLLRSWELAPTRGYFGWIAEWSKMEREGPDAKMAERLAVIAGAKAMVPSDRWFRRLCDAVALLLQGNPEKALAEVEQLVQLEMDKRYVAYYLWCSLDFWKGMVCASLGQDKEAMIAIEKALEDLPPVLLTPLHWLESERPDFYANYIVPLLAQFE